MFTEGGKYNWKCDPVTKLVYLGKEGSWHQFAKVDDPTEEVWCEVLDRALGMLEPTPEDPG